MSNSMTQNLYDGLRILQKIHRKMRETKATPKFGKLTELADNLKKEEGLSGTAGDKAHQAVEKFMKNKQKFLKDLSSFEKLTEQTLKSADAINTKSAASMKQTSAIVAGLGKLAQSLAEAQKSGDSKAEEKAAKALAAQAKQLEKKLAEVTARLTTAKIQYDLVKTTCLDYPFPK